LLKASASLRYKSQNNPLYWTPKPKLSKRGRQFDQKSDGTYGAETKVDA
jgi:hypothetical protein